MSAYHLVTLVLWDLNRGGLIGPDPQLVDLMAFDRDFFPDPFELLLLIESVSCKKKLTSIFWCHG
jgi:hypothetical protein